MKPTFRFLGLFLVCSMTFAAGVAHAQYPLPLMQQPEIVRMDNLAYFAVPQGKPHWCWAAGIEMALRYYGIAISQQDIVARSYGDLRDWSAGLGVVTRNLNNWSIDYAGRAYVVKSILHVYDANPNLFLSELANRHPILARISDPYVPMGMGHIVVVAGVEFKRTPWGPVIERVYLLDPYPTPVTMRNQGRIWMGGATFRNRLTHWWRIRVFPVFPVLSPY